MTETSDVVRWRNRWEGYQRLADRAFPENSSEMAVALFLELERRGSVVAVEEDLTQFDYSPPVDDTWIEVLAVARRTVRAQAAASH